MSLLSVPRDAHAPFALAASLAALLPACAVVDEGDLAELDERPTRVVQAIAATNGLSFNGVGGNGLSVNGLSINGIGANGLAVNGIAINGRAINGLAVNGIAANGIAANGLSSGLVLNGLAVNGIGVNGLYVNGIGVNGLYVNGLAVNGIAANGIGVNGIAVNGLYVNGIAVNGGVAMNGLYVNGIAVNGVGLNGLAVNGASAATAIKVGLANGTIGALSSAQATELRDRVLPYLAYCALPASTKARDYRSCATDPGCVSITDAGGVARYYWGHAGYAPEWRTGPLSAAGSDKVEGCLVAACAAAGGDCQKGIALNAQQEAQLQTLLKYAVSCALPAPSGTPPTTESTCASNAGCASIKNSAGVAILYHGELGLAPEWKTGPLTTVGQQRVSACLAARTNADGEHVLISMRGVGLGASPVEKERFRRHEGGFYGNLFGATPQLRSCEVDGGDMAGRVCADGSCGFVWDGACKSACSATASDGTYSTCSGSTQVLNTFLPFQKTASAGDGTTCIVAADGYPWCWGDNDYGELGIGATGDRNTSAVRVALAGDFPVDQVTVGSWQVCARKTNGTIWCWGRNNMGQLGDGTTTNRTRPVQVPLSPVIDIDANSDTTCALKADGSAWCWGRNADKQVGDNTTVNRTTPTPVIGLSSGVVQVAPGEYHTCALKADGSVWCWGRNNGGRLGNNSIDGVIGTPGKVTSLGTSVVELTAGYGQMCARKVDGTVWCWGVNSDGQLGNGGGWPSTPAQVKLNASTTLADAVGISAGDNHTCAVTRSGSVYCWGRNEKGEVGDGTTTMRAYATRVNLGAPAASVRAGWNWSCAQLRDGTEKCWGRNTYGQLADGTTTHRSTPVRMKFFVNAGDGVCNFGESSVTEAGNCAVAEVCQDRLDNDGDGKTDCADSSCTGEATCLAP